MENHGGDNPLSDNVGALLIAMSSVVFVISIYNVMVICLCQTQRTTNQPWHAAAPRSEKSTSTSVANLIPTHKFHKSNNVGVVSGNEGGMCAICLGDFEEGEELRTMPECLHSFHVPCIDMWFHSHSSCPICRASIVPSPTVNEQHHMIDMSDMAPPFANVQNEFVRL